MFLYRLWSRSLIDRMMTTIIICSIYMLESHPNLSLSWYQEHFNRNDNVIRSVLLSVSNDFPLGEDLRSSISNSPLVVLLQSVDDIYRVIWKSVLTLLGSNSSWSWSC